MPESDLSSKNIFIAPLNWGLGHSTRILPLIRKFLASGAKVYIGASGRSKDLLKKEVGDCTFVDFPAYPVKYSRTRFFVTRFMLIIFPQMLIAMWKEKRRLQKLHQKYHFHLIISDNRFSLILNKITCYLISHQLRYKLPKPIHILEWLPEYFNYRHFRKYDKIIIPDCADEQSLTGELSHDMRYLPEEKLYYTGILTDMVRTKHTKNEKIDYFVIVSGPEPQRTQFEKIILRQIGALKGKIVVALGVPEKNYKIRMGNVIFYTYLNREEISHYMDRAEFIIARPGYTTVMEMVEFGKRGLLVPTPGQVEQVYLAKYFMENGWCYSASQIKFNLLDSEHKAQKYPGFPKGFSVTAKNLERLFGVIHKDLNYKV
jgi:uncharacterized protein (TIGR00661 family)